MACKVTLNGKVYTEAQFKNLLEKGLLFQLLKRDVVSLSIDNNSLSKENSFREMFPENSDDLLKSIEKIFGIKGDKAVATLEMVKNMAKGYMDRNPGKTIEDYIQTNTFVKISEIDNPQKDENLLFSGLEEFRFVDGMQFEDDDARSSYTVYRNGDEVGQVEIQKNKEGEFYASWFKRTGGEQGDGARILKATMQNLLNKGFKVGVDQNITKAGFSAMKKLADEGFLKQVGEEITEANQRSLKPMFYEKAPFEVVANPNEDGLLFQKNNIREVLEKVIKGFELVSNPKAFSGAFVTKNGKATPLLANQINKFIKDTLGINGIEFKYEKTYGTVNISFRKENLLFQKAQAAILLQDVNDIIYAITNPNVTSLPHELVHKFEKELTSVERDFILQSYNENVERLTQVKSDKSLWDRDVSEFFARGFEKYLYDGVAPSSALQELFTKFSEWLREIYKFVIYSNIDIVLNKNMKSIYAKMLGTEYEAIVRQEIKSQQQINLDKELEALNAPISITKKLTKDTLNPSATVARIEVAFFNKEYDDLVKSGELTIDELRGIAMSAGISEEKVLDVEARILTEDTQLPVYIEEVVQKEPEDTSDKDKKGRVSKYTYKIYTVDSFDIEDFITFETKKEFEDYLKKIDTSKYDVIRLSKEDKEGSASFFPSPLNKERRTFPIEGENRVKEVIKNYFNTFIVQTIFRNYLKETNKGKKLVVKYLSDRGYDNKEEYIDQLFKENTYIRESDGKIIYNNKASGKGAILVNLEKLMYSEISTSLFNKFLEDSDSFYEEYIKDEKIESDLYLKADDAASKALLSNSIEEKEKEVAKLNKAEDDYTNLNEEERRQLQKELTSEIESLETSRIPKVKKAINNFKIKGTYDKENKVMLEPTEEQITEQEKEHENNKRNLLQYERDLKRYKKQLDFISNIEVFKKSQDWWDKLSTEDKEIYLEDFIENSKESIKNTLNNLSQEDVIKLYSFNSIEEFDEASYRKNEVLSEIEKLEKTLKKVENSESSQNLKDAKFLEIKSKINSLKKSIGEPVEEIETNNKETLIDTGVEYEEDSRLDNFYIQTPKPSNFASKELYNAEVDRIQGLITLSKFLAKKFPQLNIYLGYYKQDFKGKIEGQNVKINLNTATIDTPFHEVMHPLVAALRTVNPDLYQRFVKESAISPFYSEVIEDPIYKSMDNESINDEVIVRNLSYWAKRFIKEDGTVDTVELKEEISSMPILKEVLKWLIGKIKEIVGNNSVYSKFLFGDANMDKEGNITINNMDILSINIREMSALIFATEEKKILFQTEIKAIQKLNAYQTDTAESASKYIKKIRKKLEQLSDVERRIGKADLVKFEANEIKRILNAFDDVTALQEFLRYSIFGLEAASDAVADISMEYDKLSNGFAKVYETDINSTDYGKFVYKKVSDKSILTEDEINSLNRKLSEATQLMSFYENTVNIYEYRDLIKNKKELAEFDKIYTNFHSKKNKIKSLMYDLAADWLFPRATKADSNMTKADFKNKLKFSIQDISSISYLAGAAINQRDPVIATVAAEIKDKLNNNHIEEVSNNTEIRRLFSAFIKSKSIPNNLNKIKQYYKENFLRKALVYKITGIDNEGNKQYGYVESYAFHEEFYYDLYDKDYRTIQEEYKKNFGEPKTEEQWKSFNDYKFAWVEKNSQNINGEQKPSNKYKNLNYTELIKDEYYNKLYTTYKDANSKYGERGLDYGIIPQMYNKKGSLDNLKNKFSSLKEYASVLKDKSALDKTSSIVTDSMNYLFDEESYNKAVSQNLDGTYYQSVNAPFTHVINIEDVDLSLNESVLAFTSGANAYNELRNVQANVENLRNLISGNTYLSIPPRKITKMSKKIDPKTGKLLPVFTTDGVPLTDEKQTKRVATVFNQFIDDVFYGKEEQESSLKIGNVNVNLNKVGNDLGFFTAAVSLAGNIVAGISNLTIGNIQSLGEAVGNKYYSPKDWAKAKYEYYKNTPNFIADFNRPFKSKITQLGIIYDAIQGEFRDKYGKNITGNILQKYFTKDTLFFISHGAEHEIQMTGFMSLMNATKVKLSGGGEVSLYDAYVKNDKGFYKLREDAVWSETDNDKFTRTLHAISKDLNGNYAKFDKGTLQRHWLGKLAMQYRKYLYPAWRSRFSSKRFDFEKEEFIEGYYRKFGKKFIEDLFSFKFNTLKFLTNQKPYTAEEAYAARKTLFDVSIMLMTTALGYAVSNMEAPEDEDDKKLRDRLMVTFLNLRKDIAGYSFLAPSEGVKIITNPAASFRNVTNLLKLSQQLFIDVSSGEMETYSNSGNGYEAGDTKLGRQVEKLIPLLNQLERLSNPEEQLKYLELTNQK